MMDPMPIRLLAPTPAVSVIDLRGLPNPEPILELAQFAQSWRDGETFRVLSDDACFASDFVRWAGSTNVQVLSLRYPTENLTEVVLRRPPKPSFAAV